MQEQFQLMGEDSRLGGENSLGLQFLFQLAQMTAVEPVHEFGFQQALHRVSGHIHRATPARSIQECPCIVHPVFTGLALLAHAVEQIAHHMAITNRVNTRRT